HRSIEGSSVGPTALDNYAGVLFALARYDEAIPLYEETIRTARDRNEPREQFDAMMELADLYTEKGDPARAVAELAELEPFLERATFGLLRRAHLAYSRGLLALGRGDGAAARALFEESVRDFDQWPAKISLNVLAYDELSRAERSLGRAEAAESAARKGLALAATFVEPGTPSYLTGLSLLELGETQLARRQTGAARESLGSAATQLQQTLGAEQPETLRALRLLKTAAS
ncbi:MAG TPA: tetratricopeptide repeat protein, partial [Thermoanaerobaculia bacterium]